MKQARQNVVIIPAFNEARTIAKLLEKVIAERQSDVIVVNDGSTDHTAKVLNRFQKKIKIFTMPTNCGKGAAMRAGADLAYDLGYKYFLFMDGDGQHDPDDIGAFFKAVENSSLVLNHRILNFKVSFISKFGRFVIRNLFNFLFHTRIFDHLSGFRGMSRDAYRLIRWKSDDYRVEIEMIARAVVNRVDCSELSSPCGKRRYKGMGWGSGFSILLFTIWCWVFKRKLVLKQLRGS